MANQICFQCFKIKGDYEVCPHCGFVEGTRAEQAYQLDPGTVLKDRYIIGTCIGFGGFGITYRSYDSVLGTIVAIKEFYPAGLVNRAEGEKQIGVFSGEKEKEFERRKTRFFEEAHNMALFSKEEDIVKVLDSFEENQTAYIIMEYIEGVLLKDRLKSGQRMPIPEARNYIVSILEALEKIHQKGIVHQDISPDNIFLTGERSIKIFDFGAAKFQGTEIGRSEEAVIKAGYTPYEQYHASNERMAYMDIYAVGAVFYHMITGEKPLEASDRFRKDELPLPSKLGVELEPNLEKIIMKAIAMKPENRFQTAEEFREAILSGKRVKLAENGMNMKKFMLAVGIVSVAAISLIAAGIIHIARENASRIDLSKAGKQNVSIWICVPEQEQQDEITSSAEAENKRGQDMMDALLGVVGEDYPDMQLQVEYFSEEEYRDKIEVAVTEGKLPDVFCTDGIAASEYCASLQTMVDSLDGGDFFLWDQMLGENVSLVEFPSALQAAILYRNDSQAQATEIETLLLSDKVKLSSEENIFSKLESKEIDTILGNLEDLPKVRSVTEDKEEATAFSAAPILENGALIVNSRYCYGVNKTADRDTQQAGMLVIAELCGDRVQKALFMDNLSGIPINRNTYSTYQKIKFTTKLAFMQDYDLEKSVWKDGKDTGEILMGLIQKE